MKQLQLILMNEHRGGKIIEERKMKELQDKEYKESLAIDEKKKKLKFEEISIEEMRSIRLERFNK